MKRVQDKITRQTVTTTAHGGSAGENGISMTPPEYGINFVDQGLGATSSRPQVTGQVLQTSAADVIQLTAAENLQVLKDVKTTNPDNSYTTEGKKGEKIRDLRNRDFVVAGSQGTWHHIYPRNLLKENLRNISKYLAATNGKEGKMTETANSHKAIVKMAANFSMRADGKLSVPGVYYWKPGNGFLGVLTNYRSDDPGSLVEHRKPSSMKKQKYQEPRDWGKGLENLSAAIGKLTTLKAANELGARDSSLDHFATNIDTLSEKLDGAAYRSIDVEGRDWKRKDRKIAWGAVSKNYELVK